MGPPGHRVGHYAVDTDGGQQQGGGCKDDEQQHGEATLGERSRNDLLHGSNGIDGLIPGGTGHLCPHGGDHAQRFGTCAQYKRQSRHGPGHELIGYLQEGEVDLISYFGSIVGIQPRVLHVPDHADNPDRAQHHDADLAADGVLTWKEALRQYVIDYRHWGRSQVIAVGEEPSEPQGYLHDARVIGSDDEEQRRRRPVLRRLGFRARPEGNRAVTFTERNQRRDGIRLAPWDRRHAFEQLLVCEPDGRRAGYGAGRQRDLRGQDVAGVEAGIDLPEAPDTLHHEPRAGEQDDSQPDFHGHEDALRAMTSATGAARAFLEGFLKVSIGAVESWGEAEQDAGDDGDYEREEQDVGIDADFLRARQGTRDGGEDEAGPQIGEQQADDGAAQRQQDTFRQ